MKVDADEVLLELTSAHVDIGLRGIPVGTCRTSAVDPLEGVSYVGYPVAELARMDPEAIIHLLLEKELPTGEQLAALKADLSARRMAPAGLWPVLEQLSPDGHPMDWMAVAIQVVSMELKTGDWLEDGRNLIAVMPHVMAGIHRIREGRGRPPDPPGLGYVEDFVAMMELDPSVQEAATSFVRVFLVLHMDHGGGNLSTFTGKAIASGHADLFATMAGSMNALSGPLHGRANQSCLEFVRRVGTDDPVAIEQFVREELAARRPIYGFGHAVLRAEDPRATVQFAVGTELGVDTLEFRTAKMMREVVPPILKENPRISNPYPNVDIVSGSLLDAVGFHDPEYYTTFFGWARVTGISAQIVDERVNMRGGRGVPIYRPKYLARDQPRRHVDD